MISGSNEYRGLLIGVVACTSSLLIYTRERARVDEIFARSPLSKTGRNFMRNIRCCKKCNDKEHSQII